MLQVDPTILIKRQVFDNFLPQDTFELIARIAMTPNDDRQVLYQLQSTVAEIDDIEEGMPHWNWMGISMIYSEDCVTHPFFTEMRELVLPVIKQKVYDYRSLVRIKANFYPWTHELKHHRWHTDLNFGNVAAVLSLFIPALIAACLAGFCPLPACNTCPKITESTSLLFKFD